MIDIDILYKSNKKKNKNKSSKVKIRLQVRISKIKRFRVFKKYILSLITFGKKKTKMYSKNIKTGLLLKNRNKTKFKI